MDWIDANTERPEHFQDVEALTNKGQVVTAWIDLFESVEGDFFDWEWMGREPLDFILKWRKLAPANIQQRNQPDCARAEYLKSVREAKTKLPNPEMAGYSSIMEDE